MGEGSAVAVGSTPVQVGEGVDEAAPRVAVESTDFPHPEADTLLLGTADPAVGRRDAPGAVAEAAEDARDGQPEGADSPRSATLRDLAAPLGALVVALLLFTAVALVGFRDHDARERDARGATAAATAALEQLLSYDYRTIAAQAEQNSALLTGEFRTEYAATMAATIAPLAEEEKTVVQARSYEAGVMGQTPDTVTVQVFVNQAKTSEGDEEPSVDQNRVIATMQRVDGRWLISGLSAF